MLSFRMRRASRGRRVESLHGFTVRINDPANYFVLVKDIFVREVYRFTADRPDPLVLDCGSNIGMSILYFKHLYPDARIVGFEPDPDVFALLQENVERNGLREVELVHAAVAGNQGRSELKADHAYASTLLGGDAPPVAGVDRVTVDTVRLRDWLFEPVDFIKLNIEGSEYEVIEDIADRLHFVKEIVIEYHHLPGLPRTLHAILSRLHDAGFEYLIHDFDAQTNPGSEPPFVLDEDSRYFLLIYAKRPAR